ncbi:MAG TPA: PBP1A family penicillin-binding protein [Pyrinomonadaceae bacterium]|nr:PBP1A family penicillin-binding protein [Pyrinomonadaceae bacterium]
MSAKTPSPRPARGGAYAHRPPSPKRRRSFIRRFWFPAVLLLALAAGGLTGIVLAYGLNYSRAAEEVKALATYRPSVVTRVYADDGETVIGEFALERRIPLKYEEIPPLVRNSILAVEDVRFFDHVGIDPIRIFGAVWKNVTTGSREGGSTLTQQIAKRLFLTPEQTYSRKVNEWVVAVQIERFYTKQQIMEMYVNNIFVGAGAYGFEAGSETYFGKQAKDMTLEEAALLAGIPKAPSQLSPTVNMQAAKERRDLVLQLMAKHGFVTQAEADAAQAKPIKLADTAYSLSQPRSSIFAYPVEEIRQQLEDKYTTRVAQSGLSVYSTINVEAQKEAYEALRKGLRDYDRGHSGWRSAYQFIGTTSTDGTQVPATPQQIAAFKHPDWFADRYEPGQYLMGLVTKIDAAKNEAAVRFGSYDAVVTAKDMGRSGRQPRAEFKVGHLAEFKVAEVDEAARRLKVELSQIPAVQGALITVNAKNGEIVAMIGGYDFNTNKFNNATQAYRQTGSCFKPFVYAAAVEWGMTPDTVVSGAPIRRGSWQPHNYDGSTGNGDVPMKIALAKSLNIPAVHLLDMVGIQTGAQMVRRFGITQPMAPYLPSALGATEVPLVEMVSAYSAFPNKGVRHEKHLIRRILDRDGTPLEEWERTTFKVMSEYVALTMVEMMRGVVSGGGTAPAASSVGVPVAGKTGTVNDHTDVWFIGYTPTYVTGVWMGYSERKKSLGSGMTGGRGVLPIWIDFMKTFLKDKPKENFEKAPKMPEDIRELHLQRQREMAEERESFMAARGERGDERLLPALNIEPKLEQITLPPAAGEGLTATTPPPADDSAKKPEAPPARDDDPPPPAPPSRPREREPEQPKKKGKKGSDEP